MTTTISYTDNDILRILGANLSAALAQGGYTLADGSPFPVVQKDQPTQQGIPSDPTVFFAKLFDKPYGFPLSTTIYDEASDTFRDIETQLYETTVQVMGLVIQDPTKPDMPTASDVINFMKLAVGSRYNARALQKKGIGILRVMDVRNDAFEDDRHRFEYHPSFDLVFTYSRVIEFVTPAVHKIVPATVEGIGTGNFPV